MDDKISLLTANMKKLSDANDALTKQNDLGATVESAELSEQPYQIPTPHQRASQFSDQSGPSALIVGQSIASTGGKSRHKSIKV